MVLPCTFADASATANDLARRTTLGIGGRPEYLFEPRSVDEAAALVRLCRRHGVSLRFLGGGSNLLVASETIEGAVIATRRLGGIEVRGDVVHAGAGASFPALARRAASLRVPALSGCSGIPGTVGGAVIMNAGGRFGTIAQALVAVEGIDREGRVFRRATAERDFGYRRSPFDQVLVTGATFRRDAALDPDEATRLFRTALDAKRDVQPLGARSAGCIFKNPDAGPSAGRLIDQAGFKGRRIGAAAVSSRHANFIVNEGGATASDIRTLITLVRDAVREAFGVDLDLEVRIWS